MINHIMHKLAYNLQTIAAAVGPSNRELGFYRTSYAWKYPFLGKAEFPIITLRFRLDYPKGLKCPHCKKTMTYKLLKEIYGGKLYEWNCSSKHASYLWQEWL